MTTLKTILKFLFKWGILLFTLFALAVGFSFLERGNLAKEISYGLNLPSKAWWQDEMANPVPQTPEAAPGAMAEWMYIGNHDEILPELKEPTKRVKFRNGQVIGALEAKEVRIYQEARAGSVVATEMAAIYGGAVGQNVQGAKVILAPDEQAEHERVPRHPDFDKFEREPNNNQGIVYGNITGGEILTLAGTTVMGSVGSPDSRLDLAGTVQGNATGQQIILRSTAVVHGDVVTAGESVVLEPGANVLGKIRNTENKPIKIVKGETAGGENFYRQAPGRADYYQSPERVVVERGHDMFPFLLWIPVLLGILASLFITYGFFTRDATASMENISSRPLKTLWMGFVSAALGVPLVFLMFITIIGIPLAIALGITLVLASLVGMSGICLKIGQKVRSAFGLSNFSQAKEMLLGILLVAHLVWIPILGWLVLLVLGIMGLGSVTMIWWPKFKERWGLWRKSRKQKGTENEPEVKKEETIDEKIEEKSTEDLIEETVEKVEEKKE